MNTKLAFVFPGQGSQVVGMGKSLVDAFDPAREVFKAADRSLGFGLAELCFNGPEEALNDTVNTQPALFTVSMACLKALSGMGEQEIKPAFVAGHSLGEYGALVAAGVLDFADALKLVRERGRLMKEAGARGPGGMAAIIRLEVDEVEAICREASDSSGALVQIANDNAPGQVVISGEQQALEKAMHLAEAAGARRVVRLPISIASHSPLMACIEEEFNRALEGTTFSAPITPVIGNVSARPLPTPHAIRQELRQQLTHQVRWTDSVRYMIGQGVTHFIEIGPKDVLSGLIHRIDKTVTCIPVNDERSILNLREMLL